MRDCSTLFANLLLIGTLLGCAGADPAPPQKLESKQVHIFAVLSNVTENLEDYSAATGRSAADGMAEYFERCMLSAFPPGTEI